MEDFDNYLNELFANILKETHELLLPEERGEPVSLLTLTPYVRLMVLKAFDDTRHQQQERAEFMGGAMGRQANPGLHNAAGLYTFLTEHLGDILNRMTQKHCERIDFGYEMVKEKVDRALRYMRDGYGFDREINENIIDNWRQAGEPETIEEWRAAFDLARARYCEAHKALPVYNEVQRLARQVAIDHGERATARLEINLGLLARHLLDREHWKKEASMVVIGPDTTLRPL